MIATSTTNTIAVVQPTARRTRGRSGRYVKIHARVRLYTAVETANLSGLSQAGAPVIVRGSATRPTTDAAAATIISPPAAVSAGLACHMRASTPPGRVADEDRSRRGVVSMTGFSDVDIVNIEIAPNVDGVNTR